MGTNGNGEEIGWNKSENVLAPGSQPPSQTPYESVCRGGDDIWLRDPDVEPKREKKEWGWIIIMKAFLFQ